MSLLDKILGKPLALGEQKKQALSVLTGVPALGLDALASTAYGPEAALMILLSAGQAGMNCFFYISLAVIGVLITLYFSYQQTTAAYPNGGGAYIVASDNLGKKVGLCAAVALLLDYLLNVCVGISAGAGAIVSALPSLYPYTLLLCLLVLFMLTLLNLRGVRESGSFFVLPTILFVACLMISIVIGLDQSFRSGGHPHSLSPLPARPPAIEHLSLWLLLGAFANGLTAMTGVEAVSNAVPLFKKPTVKNAQWTLTCIAGLLGGILLFLGYLCPAYGIVAMDQTQPGYQTILSQLVAATTGKGVFYYFANACFFIILTYSAQTSFIGFPRVCRLLAEDNFMPNFFAERGRRLVFSHGIIVLAFLSAVLLIVFKGITYYLIPLFAIGAFSAFLFSQSGMVIHWLKKTKKRRHPLKLFFNALGASTTAFALIIIVAAKFREGGWIIIVLAPVFVLLFTQVHRHYRHISREIDHPLDLQAEKRKPPIVIIPIKGWDRVAEKALRFGLLLSDEVIALNIDIHEGHEEDLLRKVWSEKVEKTMKQVRGPVPKLVIINSPFRKLYQPILTYVQAMRRKRPDRTIAVVIPELVEPHWYEYLLHSLHAAGLRTLLFLQRDQKVIVIPMPWFLHE